MKLKRPTRWPCSADSSRNAGPAPRSFKKAETGVSVSSTNVWRIGTRLWATASARAVSSDGAASATPMLLVTSAAVTGNVDSDVTSSRAATALKEHPLGVGQRQAARPHQDGEVVEHVGG